MSEHKKFSIRARLRSFRYAGAGLLQFFRSEHNAWIHLAATFFVVAAAILLPVNKTEVILLVVVTGGVWTAELFNTAVEKMMDHISPDQHPGIRFIKDVSAGAVLVMAVVSLITAGLLFIPLL